MTDPATAALDLPAPPEPSSLRLVATLTLAGLGAGLLLASVYTVTLPAIEANARKELRAAVFEVVPGTKSFRELVLQGDAFVPLEGKAPKDAISVYCAYDGYGENGKHLGFAIPGQGAGFQDTIRLIYGYDPARKVVVGMKVLDNKETPGLGDKIVKDAHFVAEFAELGVTPAITVVPNGTGTATHHVDGITGATISSKAVVKILNTRNAALLDKLPVGNAVPPAPTEDSR
jgi:electron transport complex protein RnfG